MLFCAWDNELLSQSLLRDRELSYFQQIHFEAADGSPQVCHLGIFSTMYSFGFGFGSFSGLKQLLLVFIIL